MGILDRFSLSKKIVLVTAGAGPLFGKSISEAMVEAGATLITASRSLQRNLAFAQALREKGYDAHGMELDITRPESIYALRNEVRRKFGHIDVLINSALARVGGSFETQTPEDWSYSSQGDMVGLFVICKAFLEDMLLRG